MLEWFVCLCTIPDVEDFEIAALLVSAQGNHEGSVGATNNRLDNIKFIQSIK